MTIINLSNTNWSSCKLMFKLFSTESCPFHAVLIITRLETRLLMTLYGLTKCQQNETELIRVDLSSLT